MSRGIVSTLARSAKGIILDTNVLLAYIVGNWNVDLLSDFKRTASYSPDDLGLLNWLVDKAGGRLNVTPGILAELCNLSDSLNKRYENEIFLRIGSFVKTAKDRRTESTKLCDHPAFPRLGFADISVIDCCVSGAVLVTDDVDCYVAAVNVLEGTKSRRGHVYNFNHLRFSPDLARG